MRKVFKRPWRMRGKYLSVFGEYPKKYLSLYGERSKFRVVFETKIVPKYAESILTYSEIRRKESMRTWRWRKEKLLVYSPNTPIDTKLSISWLKMVHEKLFGSCTLFISWVGLNQKIISRYCPFLNRKTSDVKYYYMLCNVYILQWPTS